LTVILTTLSLHSSLYSVLTVILTDPTAATEPTEEENQERVVLPREERVVLPREERAADPREERATLFIPLMDRTEATNMMMPFRKSPKFP